MRLVLAVGCFDLLHVAHLRHLEQARRMGDRLIVGVTMDEGVKKEGRPIIPQDERLEMIKGLKCVYDASLCLDSMDALRQWKPKVFCKGHDYVKKGLLPEEITYCELHGITMRFTRENSQTTSGIIERIKCV